MKSIITFLVAFLLGGAAAYFYLNNQKEECCAKTEKVEQKKDDIILFQESDVNIAHAMSAAFRQSMGLCGVPPTPDNLTGVFEMKLSTMNDLVNAAQAIEASIGAPNITHYRIFMGLNTAADSTQLLVVGVGQGNKEYDMQIKLIDGYLPCPKYCDIKKSKIFWGTQMPPNSCN